jgi:hypothetical protein
MTDDTEGISGIERLRLAIRRDRGEFAPSRPLTLCGEPDGTERRADAREPEQGVLYLPDYLLPEDPEQARQFLEDFARQRIEVVHRIMDHAARPGPGYWDGRCLVCSQPVDDHAGRLVCSQPVDDHAGRLARWCWRRARRRR